MNKVRWDCTKHLTRFKRWKEDVLEVFLAFKSTPNSREKVSNSDLQDKAEEAHQPSQYRALSKIPKLPLSGIHAGRGESYAGRGLWRVILGFFKFWAPTANPLAQFESNQLLAHFSSIFLQLKPNLSIHITQNFRKLPNIDLAHSRILPRLSNLKLNSSKPSSNWQVHPMNHLHSHQAWNLQFPSSPIASQECRPASFQENLQ